MCKLEYMFAARFSQIVQRTFSSFLNTELDYDLKYSASLTLEHLINTENE